jgi:hypothetical protein
MDTNMDYKYAMGIIDSLDCKDFMDYMDSENFENFKNNICHILNSMGDLPFLISILKKDVIRFCYQNNILLECYYLLVMIDYLCRLNDLPLDGSYNDIRQYKLKEPVFPEGIDFLCYIYNNNIAREDFLKKAIPEFLMYNIVESDIRNVA